MNFHHINVKPTKNQRSEVTAVTLVNLENVKPIRIRQIHWELKAETEQR